MSDTYDNIDSNTEYTERAYQTREIATMLDMAVPTVRKYSQSLERAGYEFIKTKGTGKQRARLFIEKDVSVLRYLKQLRENSNITVDEAVSIVIDKFGKGAIQAIRHSDTAENEQHDKQYDELLGLIQKQNEMIQGLYDRLDKQDQYINESINKRDQNIMQLMNDMSEQKQIAATEEGNESKKDKGFFAKLFGK